MTQPMMTVFRLTQRGGLGLACDEKGVALGPIVLVEAVQLNGKSVCKVRPAAEIARTLALAYGAIAPTSWHATCAASMSPPARSKRPISPRPALPPCC
jgi:hypothetical protein